MSKRVLMRADLRGLPCLEAEGVRPYASVDRHGLGLLLFEAYLGTIDQAEETLDQAHAEIEKTISGEYGVFLPRYSMVLERSGTLHSAALLTRFQARPFLAFSMTRPESKNQGFARACISTAMAGLLSAGETELRLVVTAANAPAFHLYQSLGFKLERSA